jgi:long-chain fatty acid transport protein
MRNVNSLKIGVLAFGCLILAGASTPAKAAGFFLQEQSAKEQGEAFAGAAANPEDASTLFFNPAGMTDLHGPQIAVDASLIIPYAHFTDDGSKIGGVIPTGGSNGGDPFKASPLPSFYMATPVRDNDLWIGLAVTSPFGLADDYTQGWFGRYNSTKTELQTIDIDPAIAYRFNNQFSIGAGVDFQHAYAQLDAAVTQFPGADGAEFLKGHSWATGFNVGVMWDVDPATKLGASWRSQVTQNISGHLTFIGTAVPPAGTYAANANLALPDVVDFAASHDVNNQLKILGSVNWYNWSRFGAINPNVTSAPAFNSAVSTRENYRNTVAVAGGAEWKQTDQLTFRGGVQFDQTPTGSLRDTRVPDSNRFWVSLGASYAFTDKFSMDAAATHIFMANASVSDINDSGAVKTVGSTTNHVDMVSLQGVVKF